jgi:hypothetical protein
MSWRSAVASRCVPARANTGPSVAVLAAAMTNSVDLLDPPTSFAPWFPEGSSAIAGGEGGGAASVEAEMRFFLARSRHVRGALTSGTPLRGANKYGLTAPLLKAWLAEYDRRLCTCRTSIVVIPRLHRRAEIALNLPPATPRLELCVARLLHGKEGDRHDARPVSLITKSAGTRAPPAIGPTFAVGAIGFDVDESPTAGIIGSRFRPPATIATATAAAAAAATTAKNVLPSPSEISVCCDAKVMMERRFSLAALGLTEEECRADVMAPFRRWWQLAGGRETATHAERATFFLDVRVRERRSFGMPDGMRADVTAVESSRIPVTLHGPRVTAAALLRRLPQDFVTARNLDPLASVGHDAWVDAVMPASKKARQQQSQSTAAAVEGPDTPQSRASPVRRLELELEFADGRRAVNTFGAAKAAELLAARADRMMHDVQVAAGRTRYGRGLRVRTAAAGAVLAESTTTDAASPDGPITDGEEVVEHGATTATPFAPGARAAVFAAAPTESLLDSIDEDD